MKFGGNLILSCDKIYVHTHTQEAIEWIVTWRHLRDKVKNGFLLRKRPTTECLILGDRLTTEWFGAWRHARMV
jgi:hypothetical protein